MADNERSGGRADTVAPVPENAADAPSPAGPAAKAIPSPGSVSAKRKFRVPETAALAGVLVLLFIFFSITSPFFLNDKNLIVILQQVVRIGIVAAPATLLLIAGQFDLSVGSTAAFTGMLVAVAAAPIGVTKTDFAMGLPLEVAILIGIAGALFIGLVNAVSVTVFRINALITTLGTLAIFRGLTKVLGNGQTIIVDNFEALGKVRLLGLPVPVYLLALVIVIFFLVLRYTIYGRSMYAIGASPIAARLAGIRINQAVFIGFILSSALAGLAGLILLSQLRAAAITASEGLELAVVTAVVLGGASLSGGRGGIVGTVLAVLIVGVMRNGMTQLGVQQFWIEVAQGMLLLIAVGFDQVRIRLTKSVA